VGLTPSPRAKTRASRGAKRSKNVTNGEELLGNEEPSPSFSKNLLKIYNYGKAAEGYAQTALETYPELAALFG